MTTKIDFFNIKHCPITLHFGCAKAMKIKKREKLIFFWVKISQSTGAFQLALAKERKLSEYQLYSERNCANVLTRCSSLLQDENEDRRHYTHIAAHITTHHQIPHKDRGRPVMYPRDTSIHRCPLNQRRIHSKMGYNNHCLRNSAMCSVHCVPFQNIQLTNNISIHCHIAVTMTINIPTFIKVLTFCRLTN